MRQVSRQPNQAPDSLAGPETKEARQIIADLFEVYYKGRPRDRAELSQSRDQPEPYNGPDLIRNLRTAFNEKCAFCERRASVEPYRFRPPADAAPSDLVIGDEVGFGHLYYTWLINDWNNLYPICQECRPTVPSYFPVMDNRSGFPEHRALKANIDNPTVNWRGFNRDRSVLIDPCGNENLNEYFKPSWQGDLIPLQLPQTPLPLSRSHVTLGHFKLDRKPLVEERRAAFNSYFQAIVTPSKAGGVDPYDFKDLEFGGAWALLLWRVLQIVWPNIGLNLPSDLRRIKSHTEEFLNDPNAIQMLWDVREKMHLEDESSRTSQVEANASAQLKSAQYSAQGHVPQTLEIRNFKALEAFDLTVPNAGEAHRRTGSGGLIILGENASGKSSVLEALALGLCARDVNADSMPYIDFARIALRPSRLGAREDTNISDATIALYFGDVEQPEIEVEEPQIKLSIDENGHISVITQEPPTQLPVYAYGSVRMFRQDMTEEVGKIQSLFDWTVGLPDPEPWIANLKEEDPETFAEIAQILRIVIAHDQDNQPIIEVSDNRQCILRRKAYDLTGKPFTALTPLREMSSGYRSVLGLACDIARRWTEDRARDGTGLRLSKANAIVLIDEIEAHLHPRWKMRILRSLQEAFPEITFIVTTHDPLCLRARKEEEILIVNRRQRTPEDAKVESDAREFIDQISDVSTLQSLTVDQLLTSDLFGLASVDDIESGVTIAKIGDLLARDGRALNEAERMELARLRSSLTTTISNNIPVGSSQVEQLIQGAVEAFLIKRRNAQRDRVQNLMEETKKEISDALSKLFDAEG